MTEPLQYDFGVLGAAERYKLVTSLIVPRPIAWISSVGADGLVNLAPFSYFGLMGSDPAVVAFAPGATKDTARNVGAGAAFVVNLVSRDLAEVMNATATEFPGHVSEPDVLGLEMISMPWVDVPRVALSPASLACREVQTVRIGNTTVVLGEVLGVSVAPHVMQDPERLYVDGAALDLIGRTGGRGGYATTRDSFELPRIPYAAWLAAQERTAE
ncbi:flavin reductase family protein [Deinococcus maricopensis]|uniref:Flavin reductase domain protein FMN-binding protein n=1 Tax=Deinococcus maricopensis (strain DSM 21211 / LMG 22137 / NRRL B-23946 / LB-34) TaxID=709986 RepID=E8U4X7_DEIML|nr:flavin reductase family protein [Deinococcus maricopensis]ADV66116.1 flavin reductase domain protein FMN-binding protein [Deinococcus maricopensis DSM 21211]